MRKFYIENQIGERKSLNGDIFLQNPAGLGVSLDPQFASVGRGFFVNVTDDEEPQGTVLGDLVFRKTAYKSYQEFINWILAAEKLFIIYCPEGNTEYWREIDLTYITKTELGVGRWLTTPISFSCLTPWYLPRPLILRMEKASEVAMRYSFRFTETLRYPTGGIGSFTAEVQPSGHNPAAVRFEFTGVVETPKLEITDAESGEVYGSCKIDTSTESGEILIISTEYLHSKVEKITAQGAEDLLEHVDISSYPYFKIPHGKLCHLKFSSVAEAPITGTAKAKIYDYYKTV